jgi:hypothetical protein
MRFLKGDFSERRKFGSLPEICKTSASMKMLYFKWESMACGKVYA